MSTALETRPPLERRAAYEPQWDQERFIVPLLQAAIAKQLELHAKPLVNPPLPKPLPEAGRGFEGFPPSPLRGGAGGGVLERKTLDVGCGKQPFRGTLHEYGFSYTGLDTQPGDGVAFVAPIDGMLPEELFAHGPFQFLLCTEVLEHVADWHAAFENLARLAAPGAKLLLTCPHVYPLHEEPFDFWRPTPHAIRHYASAAGFRVVSLETIGTAWDVLGTTLGACTISRGEWSLKARIAAWFVRRFVKTTFWFLRRGWLQTVPLGSKLYLSNVAVLERE